LSGAVEFRYKALNVACGYFDIAGFTLRLQLEA
jgi:hypothetical protein